MTTSEPLEKSFIILGAGGHAVVIADALKKCGFPIRGFLDDGVLTGVEILGIKVLGKIEDCRYYQDCLFIIGIGDNTVRGSIAHTYRLEYGTVIHPSAIIGHQVSIGAGTVVMAGCVINSGTIIGEHCIINTTASVDHDNRIGDFTHISPGAVLGGSVVVGSGTHIGIGAKVKNNITISENVVVGVGAVIIKGIEESGTYVGVPARRIK